MLVQSQHTDVAEQRTVSYGNKSCKNTSNFWDSWYTVHVVLDKWVNVFVGFAPLLIDICQSLSTTRY